MDNVFLKLLYGNIKDIVNSCVIKYNRQAEIKETVESRRASDRYVSASLGLDSFNTYVKFSNQAFQNIGIMDIEEIKAYNADKSSIPYDKRQSLVNAQRKIILSDYTELNDYYRCLMGLPDVDDMAYIFIDEDICKKYDIDPDTPIHELSDSKISALMYNGHIDELKRRYPTKKYLNHLGLNKINVVEARNSLDFTILKYDKSKINAGINSQFLTSYAQSREYFMTVIYSKDMADRYDYYDNFIAMMIMVMTIQRMVTLQFKAGIDRDFYDLDIIEIFFETYNVPFVQTLSLSQQRALMRNLNTLLSYKSTDKVIVDICEILGYTHVNIFSYYMVKQHKLDDNEDPIFLFKEVTDPITGELKTVPDNENMYDVFFKTVDIRNKDIALELTEGDGEHTYEEIVSEDNMWWDDPDLQRTIYETEFNYIETKYMGMSVMFRLAKITFETCYLFGMLFEKKDELQYVKIQLPRIIDGDYSLFEVATFLSALLSKKNKFKGNVLLTPTKILSIYGFNFKADFDAIRQFIKENSKTISPVILRYIENINANSIEEVNRLFFNIKGLNDFLIDKINKSKSIKEYRLYKQLFDTLMYTNNTNEMFTMSNGKVAETYLEYLENECPGLYELVYNTDDESKLNELMQHALYRLDEVIDDLSHMDFVTSDVDLALLALTKLVNFFKSFTVDLTTYNIFYLLDHKMYNMVRMICDPTFFKKIEYCHGLDMNYSDKIHDYMVSIQKLFRMKLLETCSINSATELRENMKIGESQRYNKWLEISEACLKMEYNDLLKLFISKTEYSEKMELFEKLIPYAYIDERMNFSLIDSMNINKDIDETDSYRLLDELNYMSKLASSIDYLPLADLLLIFPYIYDRSDIKYMDDNMIAKTLYSTFLFKVLKYDSIELDKITAESTNLSLNERVRRWMALSIEDSLSSYTDRIHLVQKEELKEMTIRFLDHIGLDTVYTEVDMIPMVDLLMMDSAQNSKEALKIKDVIRIEKQ